MKLRKQIFNVLDDKKYRITLYFTGTSSHIFRIFFLEVNSAVDTKYFLGGPTCEVSKEAPPWLGPTGEENFGILYPLDWLKLPLRKSILNNRKSEMTLNISIFLSYKDYLFELYIVHYIHRKSTTIDIEK